MEDKNANEKWMNQLPSYKFVWENHCLETYNIFWDIINKDRFDLNQEDCLNLIFDYSNGWCYGGSTPFKPRPSDENVAIMFVLNDEEFWFHEGISLFEYGSIFGNNKTKQNCLDFLEKYNRNLLNM